MNTRELSEFITIVTTPVLNTFVAVILHEVLCPSMSTFSLVNKLQVCTTRADGNVIFNKGDDSSMSIMYLS